MSTMQKFTVIVPTRERADVLGPALRTIVMQDYDNLQILVSDNFSNDATRDVVDSLRDPRIIYLNTGKRLSMSHNWEFALAHVSDGWVSIVGDDDGLLPGAIARASQLAGEFGVQAIISRNAAYNWPNTADQPFGRLSVSLKQGVAVQDSMTALKQVFSGRGSYSSLPMLYTGGFVDFDLVSKARSIDGTFYHSLNPDVYSAVVFARMADRFLYSNEPLAVNGSSSHSGGTSYFSKQKSVPFTETPGGKFISEPNIPFHEELVVSDRELLPPSIELIAYESLLQSERLMPLPSPLTGHAEQLAIILGRAKRRHRKEVTDWGTRFAERHGLDIGAINRRAKTIRLKYKLLKSVHSLTERRSTARVSGSSRLPIKDVYEASIAAATIVSLHKGSR